MVNLSDYDYFLPKRLIANSPAEPRDYSRLFVYDTAKDEIHLDRFINLDQYLPEKTFLMLNDTKVLPARVEMLKENKTKVVVLFLVNEIVQGKNYLLVKGLVDRKINLQDKIYFDREHSGLTVKQEKNIFTFQFNFSKEKLFFLLDQYGKMPLPLYIKDTPLSEKKLRNSYQTIFALNQGSAAAPTASLHFTDAVFSKLDQKNISRFFTTLHVGLGTFAPIDENNLKEKKLHNEYYEVEKEQWKKALALRNKGYKLTAVGTTVVRTLETIGLTKKLNGETSIFIYPPFNFQSVDCLVTNFHLPKSSLMLLIEAFLEHKKAKRKLVDLYQIAIKNHFRFYSFGDAMLLI